MFEFVSEFEDGAEEVEGSFVGEEGVEVEVPHVKVVENGCRVRVQCAAAKEAPGKRTNTLALRQITVHPTPNFQSMPPLLVPHHPPRPQPHSHLLLHPHHPCPPHLHPHMYPHFDFVAKNPSAKKTSKKPSPIPPPPPSSPDQSAPSSVQPLHLHPHHHIQFETKSELQQTASTRNTTNVCPRLNDYSQHVCVFVYPDPSHPDHFHSPKTLGRPKQRPEIQNRHPFCGLCILFSWSLLYLEEI